MAHNTHTTCAFFLIALLMFAAANPLADAQIFGGLIAGILSSLGLRPGGPSIPISTLPQPLLTSLIGPLVQRLNISGTLCCTPTGNCNATGGPPLSGALVKLNCTTNRFAGGSLILGEGRTDIKGYFNISVSNILAIIPNLFPILPCKIDVNLDRAVCPILSTVNGTVGAVGTVLTGVVRPVSLTLNQLLGLIFNLTVGLFVRVN